MRAPAKTVAGDRERLAAAAAPVPILLSGLVNFVLFHDYEPWAPEPARAFRV